MTEKHIVKFAGQVAQALNLAAFIAEKRSCKEIFEEQEKQKLRSRIHLGSPEKVENLSEHLVKFSEEGQKHIDQTFKGLNL